MILEKGFVERCFDDIVLSFHSKNTESVYNMRMLIK